MKKLLVVLLVLGFVSTASSDYNPGWFFTIDAPSNALLNDIINVSVEVGSTALTDFSGSEGSLATMTITGGTVSNVVINGSAGWGPIPQTPAATAAGNVISIAAEIGTTAIAASTILFTFDVLADTLGTLVIDASSGNWANFTAVSGPYDGYWNDTTAPSSYMAGTAGYAEVIVEIPEPMTLALLGLGGLFLRRRKIA